MYTWNWDSLWTWEVEARSMRTETTQRKKAREHAMMGTDGESNIEKENDACLWLDRALVTTLFSRLDETKLQSHLLLEEIKTCLFSQPCSGE